MIVAKKASFDAAHFLPNYEGKCHQLHGHRWLVEIAVEGNVDKKMGMVIDFMALNYFLNEYIVSVLDHHLVNDIIENPTAENIALWINEKWNSIQAIRIDDTLNYSVFNNVSLKWIKVWETEDSVAEYRP